MSSRVVRFAAVAVLIVGLSACSEPGTPAVPASSSGEPAPVVPAAAGEGCSAAGDLTALADLTLVDALKAMPQVTGFAAYADIDATKRKQYNGLNGVTVFAPVDSAFGVLDSTTAQQLADTKWQLAAVEYAIVPKIIVPTDFGTPEAAATPTFRAADQHVALTGSADAMTVNGSATVVCSAITFSGGLIYLTDRFVLPSA